MLNLFETINIYSIFDTVNHTVVHMKQIVNACNWDSSMYNDTISTNVFQTVPQSV